MLNYLRKLFRPAPEEAKPTTKLAPWRGAEVAPRVQETAQVITRLMAETQGSGVQFSAQDIINSLVISAGGNVTVQQPTLAHSANTTLPALTKTFVGRVDLLADLKGRIGRNQTVNITSLRGVGGVGKSMLALKAAHDLADSFPGGRHWLDLRGGDAATALRRLLIDLGLTHPEQLKGDLETLAALLRSRLQGQRVLLVLDNAESIPRSEIDLLCLPPPAVTLITSRTVIDPSHELRVDVLSEADGLELLSSRGIATASQAAAASRLIARLGGLALALDITARRMALSRQTCQQALDELATAPSLVDALRLPLQQSRDDNIAACFALTYERLDPALQAAFHALGVCAPSGADATALAHLCQIAESDANERLLALSLLSLAEYEARRAQCHPLLHSYAWRCAGQQEAATTKALLLRHLRYYGVEIGGAYQRYINNVEGEQAYTALARIDAEFANVELAQQRLLDPVLADSDLMLRATNNLASVWERRAHSQRRDWLTAVIERGAKSSDQTSLAECMRKLGDVHLSLAEYGDARRRDEQALPLFQQIGDKVGEANCIQSLGDVHYSLAEYGDARRRYEQALPLFQQIGAKLGEANCIKSLGDVHYSLDEYGDARRRYEQALPLYQQIGAKLGEANCIKSLGDVHYSLDEYGDARRRYEQALPLFQQIGAKLGEANCIKSLGDVHRRLAEYGDARRRYEQALPLFQQIGSKLGEANCIKSLGDVHLRLAEYGDARRRDEQALPLYQQIGDKLGEANCIRSLGDVHYSLDEYGDARRRYEQALPLYQQIGDKLGEANCIRSLGDVHYSLDEYGDARRRYEQALPLFQQIGDKLGEANCIKSLGDVHYSLAEYGDARRRYEQALPLYQQIGAKVGEANCIKSLGDVHRRLAEYGDARRRYEQALPLFQQIGDKVGEHNVLCGLADLDRADTIWDQAEAKYQRALTYYRQINMPFNVALALQRLGHTAKGSGNLAAAGQYYQAALEIFSRIGSPMAEDVQRNLQALKQEN